MKKRNKNKKNMTEEIKEDLNDMTFFDRNILGFNKDYDLKLYEQKIKKLEDYSLEDYLKYYLKKEEKKQEEEEKKRQKEEEKKDKRRKKNQKTMMKMKNLKIKN